MSNESISQKAGNATNGTVGDETLLHQAQHLASSTLDYSKGVLGLGKGAEGAKSVDDAAHNKQGEQGSHTLGGLVNESRDFAANVLHAVSDVVGSGADKAKQAAGDAQESNEQGKPVGYVAQARDLAASALSTAESILATGQKKINETSGDDVKAKADEALNSLNQKVADSKGAAQDAGNSADSYAAVAQKNVGETTAQVGSDVQKQLQH
ncbi:hypothetical protein JCM21900_005803 [Sporobolomyces salmonicolor]